jgi:hypothetical protein
MGLGSLQMRRHLRLSISLAAVGLAVAGVSACGSDDDEPASSAGSTTQTETQAERSPTQTDDGGAKKAPAGPVLTGDVEQARAGAKAVGGVYEDFDEAVKAGIASTDIPARDTLAAATGNKSLGSLCDLMSEDAKRQTIVYAKRSAGLADVNWTCENATGLLLRRSRQAGGLKRTLRAEIIGVNVDGDQATASVRFGGKGPISAIPLVKEDGSWKLAASPTGEGDG